MRDIYELVNTNGIEALNLMKERNNDDVLTFVSKAWNDDEVADTADIFMFMEKNYDTSEILDECIPCVCVGWDNGIVDAYVLRVAIAEKTKNRGEHLRFLVYIPQLCVTWMDEAECSYNSENNVYEHINNVLSPKEDGVKLRVCFRSEIVVKGKDVKEAMQVFENVDLFNEKSGASFIEVTSVENADTFEDIPNWYD